MRKKRRRKKIKVSFQKIAVVALLVQVFAYTWAHLILSYLVGVEIAPTVSVAFYGFCGGEAGLLAWIKYFKTKREVKKHETADFSEADQP